MVIPTPWPILYELIVRSSSSTCVYSSHESHWCVLSGKSLWLWLRLRDQSLLLELYLFFFLFWICLSQYMLSKIILKMKKMNKIAVKKLWDIWQLMSMVWKWSSMLTLTIQAKETPKRFAYTGWFSWDSYSSCWTSVFMVWVLFLYDCKFHYNNCDGFLIQCVQHLRNATKHWNSVLFVKMPKPLQAEWFFHTYYLKNGKSLPFEKHTTW
jgi:hypothetical protein